VESGLVLLNDTAVGVASASKVLPRIRSHALRTILSGNTQCGTNINLAPTQGTTNDMEPPVVRVEQRFGNSESTHGGFSFQGNVSGDLQINC
jgi:hypothetical protein